MDDVTGEFEELGARHYPGSKQPRKMMSKPKPPPPPDPDRPTWDRLLKGWPKKKLLQDGREVEFFTIGALAFALNRSPVTIRKLIRQRVLPDASYRTRRVENTRGNAPRRLWTREQIEGLIRIADEEGVLDPEVQKERGIVFKRTHFTERAFALFGKRR